MFSRGALLLVAGLLVTLGVLGWVVWNKHPSQPEARQTAAPIVVKRPVNFATRTFDPANPPADMPPLPDGETAECDSNFISNATVGGQIRRTDATHATVTITQIRVTLELNVTVWVPEGVSAHIMEHEEGHRQISEYYYQNAEQVAGSIANRYMGKQISVSGADLDAEAHQALQNAGGEIDDEYNKELNPNPTQLLYDSITDHSRNDIVAADAVAHALKNVAVEAPASPANDGPANP